MTEFRPSIILSNKIVEFHGARTGQSTLRALQISIGWLSVISSVIPLALKVVLPIRIIPLDKIL